MHLGSTSSSGFLATAIAGLIACPGWPQTLSKPTPGDVMIDEYLTRETERLSRRFLDGATSRAEWEARRPRLRQEYLDMLGLWPLPAKTPLNPKITGTVVRDHFVVDKLHFQSRPGLYVTGNLYRPRRPQSEKLPTVLYVCGHYLGGRDGNKADCQEHGIWFAKHGYVCLVLDTLELGELAGFKAPGKGIPSYDDPWLGRVPYDGVRYHKRWWWLAAGYTTGGVECWNGIRALDYLVSRPDVDPERIALTGISGGGSVTIQLAAADERVRCAVPVSGMSDLETYVSHRAVRFHCDCLLFGNTYQWEWTTIPALIAPRPMLFCNSDNDWTFPMDANRRIIDRLRRLYQLCGKPELVDAYVSKGGHEYRPDLRIAIFRWINKQLKNDTGPVQDVDSERIPRQELRVFAEDKDLPQGAINSKIDEMFVPLANANLPEARQFDAWKQGRMKRLREQSFRPFPERIPAARRTTPQTGQTPDTPWSLTTELGIQVRAAYFTNPKQNPKTGTILVLNSEEEMSPRIPDWARTLVGDGPVCVLKPRDGWTKNVLSFPVERSHYLLGRTVDQGRVWDIAATARFLAETSGPKSWRVVGRRQSGILGVYAALFEPVITEVIVVNPPRSHREEPIFLNVLRVLDLPDALGLVAPRALTLVEAQDPAFARTLRIYQAAGAEAKLQRLR